MIVDRRSEREESGCWRSADGGIHKEEGMREAVRREVMLVAFRKRGVGSYSSEVEEECLTDVEEKEQGA